jgi:uncharacterized protein (DUF433 family)
MYSSLNLLSHFWGSVQSVPLALSRLLLSCWAAFIRTGGKIEGAVTDTVIVIDQEIMNGTPCFRGTRVPFKNLIDYLEGGHPLDEFLRQFPAVTREMAVQALEEAKDSLVARIA